MKIEALGTGCASCKTLYENVMKTVEMGYKDAKVVKVEEKRGMF